MEQESIIEQPKMEVDDFSIDIRKSNSENAVGKSKSENAVGNNNNNDNNNKGDDL